LRTGFIVYKLLLEPHTLCFLSQLRYLFRVFTGFLCDGLIIWLCCPRYEMSLMMMLIYWWSWKYPRWLIIME